MTVLILIGFLMFVVSIFYLIIHLIKKVSDRSRILSKKIFYSTLIGGLFLFIIGVSFLDTEIQQQLNEALEINNKLTVENNDLKAKIMKLQEDNDQLIIENKKVNEKFEEVVSKITAAENAEQEMKQLQTTFNYEKEALTSEITELKLKNENLQNEVAKLNNQLATKNTNTRTASNNTTGTTSSSSGIEYFANCTELRKVYPKGVPSDHPAYQPKMDRDKDGWACER